MTLISDRIRELRENKKISSKDLCSILNFNPSTYSKLENNKKSIDVEELKKISEFYNVSADYILGIDKPKNDIIAYMKKDKELDDNDIKEVQMILSMMDEAIAFNEIRSRI
ncbi:helix-turn-helix domain-containing protein [Ruminiclostridium herbifermentans]|uniref:Helix-turn-helix domain-containing protein n=1 Tax=Ruminiclostridium herbifermentans TaxID=2488810 RepID=A0A4U7JIY0_9FIRM|nr:helix-turn-helix transcriptional regulator [Ruminiclostridium herbifermentans]QNU67171.1 helix-turn-helix domain-containing protein [Ruminiclostridium herbifermentans]